MRKLRLDVHALRVESFEASARGRAAAGTVRGNASGVETCGPVTYCADTCYCANTSPRPSCDDCSWKECSGDDSCAITNCLTCLCPHTGPQPSCDPCSWMECDRSTSPPVRDPHPSPRKESR